MSARPSVLWVTAEAPNAAMGGGNIRQSRLLSRLGLVADVDLLVLGHDTDDDVRAVVRDVTELAPVRDQALAGRPHRWAHRLRVLAVDRSTAGIDQQTREARPLIDEARRAAPGHDIVIAQLEGLAVAVPERRTERWWLQLHHVPGVRSAQRAEHETDRRRRLLHRLEAANADRWLRRCLTRWDGVLTVSEEDARALDLPAGRFVVSPNGVDLERFRPTPRPRFGPIVLTASFDYVPNVDGARWFVEHVWPRIRARHPDRRLQLVGRAPVAVVRALTRHRGVDLHADVPEIPPWLEGASAVVVPLRIGTGTRLKALEAMAAARPLVGTAVGLEGIGIESGRHALVADTAPAFADAVCRVLEDVRLADHLAATARQHVEDGYGWDRIAERYMADVLAPASR